MEKLDKKEESSICRQDARLYRGCMDEATRTKIIRAIDNDPLQNSWEPSIWWVADAIVDFPFCTSVTANIIRNETNLEWEDFKKAMRKKLGIHKKVDSILISGANRSSKSQYAAKRAMLMATNHKNKLVMGCHTQKMRSKTDQQKLFWLHFPPEWRKKILSEKTFINYTVSGGFRENHAILPNETHLMFTTYTQQLRSILEGTQPIFVNLDENFTDAWLKTVEIRTAQNNGIVICTNTPVDGWASGVGSFMDNMKVLKTIPAYLLPKDGKEVLPYMALGLTNKEYKELEMALEQKREALAPEARPQNCLEWLKNKDGLAPMPANRSFHTAPRVAISMDGKRGTVWMSPMDNPYGNPKEIINRASQTGIDGYKRYIYAILGTNTGIKFPQFEGCHIIKPSEVPKGGINTHICDPAFGRNWFQIWAKNFQGKVYIYREWPGTDYIPGHGILGEWANPAKGGRHDGEKGEAQELLGFTLLRYKFEWARLENWLDYQNWVEEAKPHRDTVPDLSIVSEWDPKNDDTTFTMGINKPEIIKNRLVDSRPANMNKTGVGQNSTMLDELNSKINMDNLWTTSSNNLVIDGVEKISGALSNNTLYISSDCKNLIWALKHWTFLDGQKGACKDPIDALRYYYDAGLPDEKEEDMERYKFLRNQRRNLGFSPDDDDCVIWEG